MRNAAAWHRRSLVALSISLFCAVLLLGACSAKRGAVPAAGAGATEAEATVKGLPPRVELPKEVDVSLRLSPGDSWKSRFVSTSETKRTLAGADGKDTVKSRTVGLEIVAMQKVTSVEGTVATVEITEAETRILQEGKFIPAPYKQFNPPNPVSFTIDTATGKTDFEAMRRAYGKWMGDVKEGPAGDILGKTFRLPAYLAALEEMYGKPFTRVSGRKLSKEETPSGKDVILPFLGPGSALAPVPVEGKIRYTGFQAKRGRHLLAVSGEYAGQPDISAGAEFAVRLSDFGLPPQENFTSSGSASGSFESTVDLLSGRELQSTGKLSYTAKWVFGVHTITEEVAGKSILEPAE